eukprot:5186880-Amphidinium_carterae.1
MHRSIEEGGAIVQGKRIRVVGGICARVSVPNVYSLYLEIRLVNAVDVRVRRGGHEHCGRQDPSNKREVYPLGV